MHHAMGTAVIMSIIYSPHSIFYFRLPNVLSL